MFPLTKVLTRCAGSASGLWGTTPVKEACSSCWFSLLLVMAPWKLPMVLMPTGKGLASSGRRMSLWSLGWSEGG